ncbi:hypothetical protein [Zhongshania borealis]|uniref:TonB-dependent receptor n=1 Tax=Zhongshania borealis TaxID=889488 RepID=A0ABP7WJJ4_9GAMM
MIKRLGVFALMLAAQDVFARGAPVLEEVIITVQKREESLQDVPISLVPIKLQSKQLPKIKTF